MNTRFYFNPLRLVLGIAIIILGVSFINNPHNRTKTETVWKVEFGGDYYTEQYGVTKKAVDNISHLIEAADKQSEQLDKCFGWLFVVIGALAISNSIGVKSESGSTQRTSHYLNDMNTILPQVNKDGLDSVISVEDNKIGNKEPSSPIWMRNIETDSTKNVIADEEHHITKEEAEEEIRIQILMLDDGIIDEVEFNKRKEDILQKVRE